MQTQPREVQSSEDDQLPGERTQSGERGCGDDGNPWVGTRWEGDSLVPEKFPCQVPGQTLNWTHVGQGAGRPNRQQLPGNRDFRGHTVLRNPSQPTQGPR